jgi:hypothetical protein
MLVTLAACLLAECGSLMPGQREARRAAVQSAEQSRDLQLRVMRFADEYVGRTKDAVLYFQTAARSPEERLTAQTWKVQQAQAAYINASGPNPASNAVDMVVLASLSRMVIEDPVVSKRYGDRLRPVRDAHRELEVRAWGLVTEVLTESQTAQLHDIINRWRREHPAVRSVAYIHLSDIARSTPGEELPSEGNLLSALGLDPLAGLDPAIHEVTQTRQLAERAIFYLQHVPNLIDMQAERLSDQFAAMPETRSLVASLDRISLIGDASERMAQSLPEVLAREREALLSGLTQGFDERRAEVSALTGDLRSTLAAGTETANALHAMLDTADRITARYAKTSSSSQSGETSPPFDIREYTEAAREVAAATQELNALTERANTLLPLMRQTTEGVADRLERIRDHLFLELLGLVVAAVATTLLAALTYRAVVAHMHRQDTSARAAR